MNRREIVWEGVVGLLSWILALVVLVCLAGFTAAETVKLAYRRTRHLELAS